MGGFSRAVLRAGPLADDGQVGRRAGNSAMFWPFTAHMLVITVCRLAG